MAPGGTVRGGTHLDLDGVPLLSPQAEAEVAAACQERGWSRRTFLQACSAFAGVLALPRVPYVERIARALATDRRLPVIWLNGQDCNGNIESFLRSPSPTITDFLLQRISLEYAELLMVPSGAAAERSRNEAVAAGGYVAVVEGAIPIGAGGAYCCVGGEAFADTVRRVARGAIATVAIGSCAFDGGLPAARGGLTGAVGVRELLGPRATVVALPGCPANAENIAATFVHRLTFGTWPERDGRDRPYFAYGEEIHEDCPRKEHFEHGRFVRAWGDEGHQQGWCLRYLGCRGPETKANCPRVLWNSDTSWPVGAGSPCFGCTNPHFWDTRGGFYARRPGDD